MTFDLVLIAIAVALDPLPLSAFIIVLSAVGGTRKGAGFLAGWLISLVGVVVLTLALTGGKPPSSNSAPSEAGLVIRIVVGAWLLGVAWSRHRTRGRPRPTPRWMSMMDRLNLASAAGLAFLLQPWGLIAAGAATVSQADLSEPGTVLAVVAFCLIGTLSYLAMELYVVVAPDVSRKRLNNLRASIDAHRDQAIIVGSLIVGLWLIGKSSYLLAT